MMGQKNVAQDKAGAAVGLGWKGINLSLRNGNQHLSSDLKSRPWLAGEACVLPGTDKKYAAWTSELVLNESG